MSIFAKNNNKEETEERVRDVVVRCFAETVHMPEHTITDASDFFEDFSTDSMDYFVLLSKIKSSFAFPIKDRLLADQTTVGGFVKKITKVAR